MFSYFQKSERRRNILNKVKSNRIIINNFRVPLGISLCGYAKPSEGVDFGLKENNLYCYRISVSANKIPYLFVKLLKLFPAYCTMVIERISEDINRDYDIMMSDPDISIAEIKNIFKKYKELWVECGFVGFGIIDERSEFEVFINLDKEIVINTPSKNIKNIDSILDYFNLLDKYPSFASDYKHWHRPLSSVVSYESLSEEDEYIFDYYDIVNNLKHTYGFSAINLYDKIIRKQPKWWSVTVKCLGKCRKISSVSTYYLVANTLEEMETLIDEKMKEMNIENYYIYDFYNMDPHNYKFQHICLKDENIRNFEKAPFGIWAESDIFIYKVKNINSFLINKNNARTLYR